MILFYYIDYCFVYLQNKSILNFAFQIRRETANGIKGKWKKNPDCRNNSKI